MPTSYRTLVCRFQPPLAFVSLDRPGASNRVNLAMAMEIRKMTHELTQEPRPQVVILTGRGRAFSIGRERIPFRTRGSPPYPLADWLEMHRAASALAGVEAPVIAAINGDATDHGLELALACDLRIVARGARLGFTDLSKGGLPWDGGTQRLARLVGRSRALEMLLTSRLLDAEEAHRAGLVNQVVEPETLMGTAESMALGIASGAPIAARYAKEAVMKGMDMALDQGLRIEADLSIILQSTSDRTEGIRAFLQKRDPTFRGG